MSVLGTFYCFVTGKLSKRYRVPIFYKIAHFIMERYSSIPGRLLFVFLILCSSAAVAQTTIFRISPEQKRFDGITKGVKPGDTIFIEAGSREELVLENITGTAKTPVIVINHGGKVIINTKKDYGILFNNSVHFKITGTGSSDTYGFEIASTANHGLVVTEFSSFCEADHLEIHHVGYAGIVAKTDPNCTRKDLRYFIMQNLSFHDNFIHDITAEGFYVGYSWYPARDYKCGQDSLLYSHEIHGVRIYNNNMRNTGQEGIQVGTGTKDVMIYSNTVFNYGVTNVQWQNHGVQIGQGTTGDFFNNGIRNGPAEAISLFGGGNNRLYNNVIVNSGAAAIYQNDRGAVAGRTYQVTNNTIINPAEYGISLVSDHTTGNKVSGNTIVIKNTANAIVSTGKMKWNNTGNKIFSSIEASGLDTTKLEQYTFKKIGIKFPFIKDNTFELVAEPVITRGNYSFTVSVKEPLLKLYNGAGILQDSNKITAKGKKYEVDLTGFANGIYYVSIWSNGKATQVQRVILQKDN